MEVGEETHFLLDRELLRVTDLGQVDSGTIPDSVKRRGFPLHTFHGILSSIRSHISRLINVASCRFDTEPILRLKTVSNSLTNHQRKAESFEPCGRREETWELPVPGETETSWAEGRSKLLSLSFELLMSSQSRARGVVSLSTYPSAMENGPGLGPLAKLFFIGPKRGLASSLAHQPHPWDRTDEIGRMFCIILQILLY